MPGNHSSCVLLAGGQSLVLDVLREWRYGGRRGALGEEPRIRLLLCPDCVENAADSAGESRGDRFGPWDHCHDEQVIEPNISRYMCYLTAASLPKCAVQTDHEEKLMVRRCRKVCLGKGSAMARTMGVAGSS